MTSDSGGGYPPSGLQRRGNHKARIIVTLTGLAGLALAIGLLVHGGVYDVVRVLARGGWGLLWLIPLRLLPIVLDASGWRLLLQGQRRASALFLVWVAAVRDSVNTLLPVARVGGEVAGLRLLMIRGVPGSEAGASIIVEVTVTLLVQFVFTLLGIAILFSYLDDHGAARDVFFGFAAFVPVVAVFLVLQRRGGLFQRLARILGAITGGRNFLGMADPKRLDRAVQALYRKPRLLAATALWQSSGLVAGSVEIWFALHLFGYPVSPLAALFFESLAQTIQSASFFVPAGLGVQEGSFVFLGAVLGLAPDVSLALSLARRLRQLGFGIPMLVSWQWVEARHLRLRLRAQETEIPR
ncbi:MAG: lysylphosphatidylglycerol synthase domain-containing protein [Acidiferrobacteraceae bacterium]